jgi:hypothetical protein
MKTFNDIETRSYIHKWTWHVQRQPHRHTMGVRVADWGLGISISDDAEMVALSLGHFCPTATGTRWREQHATLTYTQIRQRADLCGSVSDVLDDLYLSLFEHLGIEPPFQRPPHLQKCLGSLSSNDSKRNGFNTRFAIPHSEDD